MFVHVANKADLKNNQAKRIPVKDAEISLFRVDDKYFALANKCPHMGGPVCDGDVDGDIVSCPWHGYQFEISSGRCLTDKSLKIKTYPVKIEGDNVLVSLD